MILNKKIMLYLTVSDLGKRENWKYIPSFIFFSFKLYSVWNIIFLILYRWVKPFVDIHLSVLITAFISFGIYEVFNEKNSIEVAISKDVTIKFTVNRPSDMIWHWLPLALCFIFIPIPRPMNVKATMFTFGMFIAYVVMSNAHIIYTLDIPMSIILLAMALIVRFSL